MVVNSAFIVSICSRLLSVVVGCGLFRLFHALSGHCKLSRLFELFNIVLPRLACLKCCFLLSRLSKLFINFSCCSVRSEFSTVVKIGLGCVWLLFSGSGCDMLFKLSLTCFHSVSSRFRLCELF